VESSERNTRFSLLFLYLCFCKKSERSERTWLRSDRRI